MKITLFSHNTHQFNYFKKIKEALPYEINIISRAFCLNLFYLKVLKNIDLEEILRIKFYEVDSKYTNKFKNTIYKKFLKIYSYFVGFGYIHNIKDENIDIVGFWNGTKFPQNIGVKIAKFYSKKTLFFENGVLPNTTTADFKGVNALNSMPRNTLFLKNFIPKKKLPTQLIARKEEATRIKNYIKLPQNFIFVPFQVSYDTQIIYHSPWIKSMTEFFELINLISKELKIHFILKEHPSDKSANYKYLHKQVKTNEYIAFANSISTQELIQKSDAIITINSSVGIEALLFEKKVIVLGEAFYGIDSITKVAKNRYELMDILKNLDNFTIDKKLVKKYLCYLNEVYLLPQSWKNPNTLHFEALKNKIKEEL